MEISEGNRAQSATLQNSQNSNRSENTSQSQNAQAARVEQTQSQASGESQQTQRANEGNTSVNISNEAQRLFANEQSQSGAPPSARESANSVQVEETASLQSGGTQSGKPR